jgi:hypothetical protein
MTAQPYVRVNLAVNANLAVLSVRDHADAFDFQGSEMAAIASSENLRAGKESSKSERKRAEGMRLCTHRVAQASVVSCITPRVPYDSFHWHMASSATIIPLLCRR